MSTRFTSKIRVTALLVMCAGLLLANAQSASGQGTGFTGSIYWGCGAPPGYQCNAPEFHSYGFASAYYGGGGNWAIFAAIQNTPLGNFDAYGSDPQRRVRVCVNGTYPNCVDSDGYSAKAAIGNYIYTHNIDGHGSF